MLNTISKKQVDRAGARLRSVTTVSDLSDSDLDTINQWRASHRFPMNTIQAGVRKHAIKINDKAIVSQRLKRLASIHAKLLRFEEMKLSRMQDLGGCRVVLKNKREVAIAADSYENSKKRHRLVSEKDYVHSPKSDGYRSLHRVYEYYSDRNPQHNGRIIEVQLRTELQHAWATALESVDIATGSDLKLGGGLDAWRQFFLLSSNLFCFREKTPLIQTAPPTLHETIHELKHAEGQIHALTALRALRSAFENCVIKDRGPNWPEQFTDKTSNGYQLVTLSVHESIVWTTYQIYKPSEFEKAQSDYARMEVQNDRNIQSVLVATKSARDLVRAYPNFFLDTRIFIAEIERAIKPKKK